MPTLEWLTRETDVRTAAHVPYKLLEADPSLSYGDEQTENMLIQGDNLDALKALLPFYAADVTGNPLSMQMITAAGDTSSFTLSYTYNTVNQLSGIMSNLVSTPNYPATLFSLGASGGYGPLGGLASATLGNGAVETYFYDQRNRLGCETVKYNSTTLYSVELSPANGQCSGNTFSNGSGIGYSGNSDVVEAFDSVNGHWTYGYDDFNRLVSAAATSGPESGKSMAWSYDRFGNRWSQSLTGQTPQSYSFDSGNHRMTQYINNYDAAGNLMLDPMSNLVYTYDDENRVIAVGTSVGSNWNNTAQYSYDAEGQRIRKVSAAGTEEYVYDKDGHQVGEMQPNGTFNRAEIYAGNRHLATYDYTPQQTIFIHNDWQGTERVRSKYDGTSYQTCTNLPFGDSQNCTVSGGANDPSPLHYTGKMRDVETNLDYFGARYYASGMAHWMSPDWADKPASVPYANFSNPQSLNLYAFVSDNPVSRADSDGHMMSIWQYWASLTIGFGSSFGQSLEGGVDGDASVGTPDPLAAPTSLLDASSQQAENRYVSITQNDYDPEGIAHDTEEWFWTNADGTRGGRNRAERDREYTALAAGLEAPADEGLSVTDMKKKIQEIYDGLTPYVGADHKADPYFNQGGHEGLHGGNWNFDSAVLAGLGFHQGRNGVMPSVHLEGNHFHVDTANGRSVAGPIHWVVDVGLGTYLPDFNANGIPR